MRPDNRPRKAREPYFMPLYRRVYAMAPLLLVLGVLLAWVLATDPWPWGRSRRDAGLGDPTPRASVAPGGGEQDAGGLALAPTGETTSVVTAPALGTAPTPTDAGQAWPTAGGNLAPSAAPGAATPGTATPIPPTMATAGASAPILAPTATATPNATPLATITAVHLVLSATPTGLSIEPPTATAGPSATASPTATPGPSVTAGPTPTRTSALPPETGWTAYGGEWDWREPGVAEGTSTEGDALWLYEETYGDFEFSAEVLTFDREASLAFRMQDENNGFIFTLVPQGATEGTPGIYLAKRVDGTDNIVAATEADDIPFIEDWATLRVEATGDSLRLYLNGALVIGYESGEDPSFPYGRVGLRIYGDAEEPCSSMFRSIRLP